MLFRSHSSSGSPARSNGAATTLTHCPDMLSLVGFSNHASVLSPFVGAFDGRFAKAVQRLPETAAHGSMTNITAGLRVANDLLSRMPTGLRRRIWLLSDGGANEEVNGLWSQVHRAKAQRTNINTIGFGNRGEFDEDLLKRIAATTHNGRYFEATTIAALGHAFQHGKGRSRPVHHRGEATVFVIDCSASMTELMEKRKRIDVVRAAMHDLILWKQATWS
jgi:Mg-chelatase subunit ChlD